MTGDRQDTGDRRQGGRCVSTAQCGLSVAVGVRMMTELVAGATSASFDDFCECLHGCHCHSDGWLFGYDALILVHNPQAVG